jgi:hypothetical protein
MLDADEPVRQLRDRIRWYDSVAELVRQALLEPRGEVNPAVDHDLEKLLGLLAQANSGNGKPTPEAVA